MSSAVLVEDSEVANAVKRFLTRLAIWYDEDADQEQHRRVLQAAQHSEESQTRAQHAVEAFSREQVTLRRRR